MSDQPETLRLVEWLENDYYDDVRITAAAAELSRLHSENDALREALRLIENTDPFDASLDLAWAVRVAGVALKEAK